MNENTIHDLYSLSYFDICLFFKVSYFIFTFSKSISQSRHYIQEIQLHAIPGTSQISSDINSVLSWHT